MTRLSLLLALVFAGSAWAMPPADAPKAPASVASTAAEAPAPTEDPQITATKAITLLEALSAAAQKHAGDCDAIGMAMLKEAQDHDTTLKALAVLKRGNEASKVLQTRYGDRAATAIRGMLKPLNACHANPRVRLALKALDGEASGH